MGRVVVSQLNGGVAVDRTASIFVGDGAGRVPPRGEKSTTKKDFGDSDLKFALNVGVQFKTPDEYFLLKKESYSTSFTFDPRSLRSPSLPLPVSQASGCEVVLFVGSPGAGKSSLRRRAFPDYVRINRDTLGTKEKCLKVCVETIAKGLPCVIDNQNLAVADRAPYIAAARKAGVPCRALRFDVPKEFSFHMNEYRALNSDSTEHRAKGGKPERVPAMVIHGFYKNVKEPTVAEGLAEVATFTLDHFKLEGSDADKDLICSFLL